MFTCYYMWSSSFAGVSWRCINTCLGVTGYPLSPRVTLKALELAKKWKKQVVFVNVFKFSVNQISVYQLPVSISTTFFATILFKIAEFVASLFPIIDLAPQKHSFWTSPLVVKCQNIAELANFFNIVYTIITKMPSSRSCPSWSCLCPPPIQSRTDGKCYCPDAVGTTLALFALWLPPWITSWP